MKEKLIHIQELSSLLGYADERSIESWCKANRVPIIQMGRNKYTLIIFVEKFIQENIKSYVNNNYQNSDSVFTAILNDNLSDFVAILDQTAIVNNTFKPTLNGNKLIQKYLDSGK